MMRLKNSNGGRNGGDAGASQPLIRNLGLDVTA